MLTQGTDTTTLSSGVQTSHFSSSTESVRLIQYKGAHICVGMAVPVRSGWMPMLLSGQILSGDGEGFEPTVRRPAHWVGIRPHKPPGHQSRCGQ